MILSSLVQEEFNGWWLQRRSMCRSNQLYDTVDSNLIAYGEDLTDLSSISQNVEVAQSVVETDDTIGSAEATGSADKIQLLTLRVKPKLDQSML